jgi:hypothetical protein
MDKEGLDSLELPSKLLGPDGEATTETLTRRDVQNRIFQIEAALRKYEPMVQQLSDNLLGKGGSGVNKNQNLAEVSSYDDAAADLTKLILSDALASGTSLSGILMNYNMPKELDDQFKGLLGQLANSDPEAYQLTLAALGQLGKALKDYPNMSNQLLQEIGSVLRQNDSLTMGYRNSIENIDKVIAQIANTLLQTIPQYTPVVRPGSNFNVPQSTVTANDLAY